MKGDFDLIVHKFDEKEISIYPIADVHFGAINHENDKWNAFVKMIEAEENAKLILNGDLINNNTRSAIGSPWDDTIRPREQKIKMVEYLAPIKDRILCITSGNHERRSAKDADDDPTYDIAAKLDLEDVYRPNAAFMKINIGSRVRNKKTNKKHANTSICFAVTHGAGGGIYTGGTVNRNERFGNVIDGIDCLVVGHTHKATVTRPSKIVIDTHNNLVTMRDYLVVSCTAWMRYGDYALQKMLLPSSTSRPQKLILREFDKYIEVKW